MIKFYEEQYIVLISEPIMPTSGVKANYSDAFRKNYCYKQRRTTHYLSVEKDAVGRENGWDLYRAEMNNWRFATDDEVQAYNIIGEPYDVSTVDKILQPKKAVQTKNVKYYECIVDDYHYFKKGWIYLETFEPPGAIISVSNLVSKYPNEWELRGNVISVNSIKKYVRLKDLLSTRIMSYVLDNVKDEFKDYTSQWCVRESKDYVFVYPPLRFISGHSVKFDDFKDKLRSNGYTFDSAKLQCLRILGHVPSLEYLKDKYPVTKETYKTQVKEKDPCKEICMNDVCEDPDIKYLGRKVVYNSYPGKIIGKNKGTRSFLVEFEPDCGISKSTCASKTTLSFGSYSHKHNLFVPKRNLTFIAEEYPAEPEPKIKMVRVRNYNQAKFLVNRVEHDLKYIFLSRLPEIRRSYYTDACYSINWRSKNFEEYDVASRSTDKYEVIDFSTWLREIPERVTQFEKFLESIKSEVSAGPDLLTAVEKPVRLNLKPSRKVLGTITEISSPKLKLNRKQLKNKL